MAGEGEAGRSGPEAGVEVFYSAERQPLADEAGLAQQARDKPKRALVGRRDGGKADQSLRDLQRFHRGRISRTSAAQSSATS